MRNKQAKGPNKSIPSYDKIYLHFPKGRFRPPGGSTKLSPNNDGPYTTTAKLLDGLVYTVKHDLLHYISNISVTRIIPASRTIIPSNSSDLPHRWQQLHDRDDRLLDIIEQDEEEEKEEKDEGEEQKQRQRA